jgi:asparagine N-glycosylation enzyme membrane subunit Stt3
MSTLSLKGYKRPLVYDGIAAGLIAGAIADAFLFATGVLSWPQSYEFIASALVGRAALASTAYVPLGIAIHFAISAAWGAAFALTAQRYPQLIGRPIVSGLVFGLVVMIVMQLLLMLNGMWHAPQSGGQLVVSIVSHTAFFGLPIAWYVERAARRTAHAAVR